MSDTPIYDEVVDRLGDPAAVAREFDEHVIRWHAARLPQPGGAHRVGVPALALLGRA